MAVDCKKCIHLNVCHQCGVNVGGLTHCGEFQDKEQTVFLPCKPDSKVWVVRSSCHTFDDCKRKSCKGCKFFAVKVVEEQWNLRNIVAWLDKIGKCAFLDKKEAERHAKAVREGGTSNE